MNVIKFALGVVRMKFDWRKNFKLFYSISIFDYDEGLLFA